MTSKTNEYVLKDANLGKIAVQNVENAYFCENRTAGMEYSKIRIGNGYDVHALKEGLPMWLCGIQIESETGFVAHSDGDVAIHALCDALL